MCHLTGKIQQTIENLSVLIFPSGTAEFGARLIDAGHGPHITNDAEVGAQQIHAEQLTVIIKTNPQSSHA